MARDTNFSDLVQRLYFEVNFRSMSIDSLMEKLRMNVSSPLFSAAGS